MLYAIVAVIVLIADQWLKYSVTVNITLATGSQELIPGVVSLVNVHNNGASFSLLGGFAYSRWLFLGIALLFVILVSFMLIKKMFPSKFVTWCAVLAMAGAIGNCIDRILYGYVVDMIRLDFMNFAVFNVADIVLVVSCVCFITFLAVDIFKDIFSHPAKAEKPEKKQPETDGKIETAEIISDAPDFPETATPIMPQEKPVVDEGYWAEFSRDLSHPTPAAKPAKAPAAEPVVEPPKAEPIKPEPEPEPEYDLDEILAEFLK